MHDSTTGTINTQPREQGRRINGKLVLLGLLLLVGVVMLVGWLALRYTGSVMAQQPPLSWEDRAGWPRRPVRETTLEASAVESLVDGTEWRELSLTVPPGEEEAVQQLAALASSTSFPDDATPQRIEAIRADHPDLFYATYLLATWHRIQGDRDRASELYEQAFEDAPRAVQQQYIDPRNRELANLPVGRVEIICYRSDDGEIDESLRLVYPELVTDERGFIYLPVYRTIYSVAQRATPAGYEVQYINPSVFQFPGRVGTLEAALVTQRPAHVAPAPSREP